MIFTKLVTATRPAAGVGGWSIAVPTGENWHVRSMKATLATSATVANRQPYCVISLPGTALDASQTVFLGGLSANVPASTTAVISWAKGVVAAQGAFATLFTAPLPDIWLPAGATIQIQTGGIQAGDQWSQLAIAVERG